MERIRSAIKEAIETESFISAVLSNKRDKSYKFKKVCVKPVLLKGEYKIQFESFDEKQAFHQNLNKEEAIEELTTLIEQNFKQMMFYTDKNDIQALISKKGKAKLIVKAPSKKKEISSHNRKKQYILNDGEKIDFLIKLGVMSEEGKVYAKKQDKFRQINRFLEMVRDTIPHIKSDEEINIVDFGCGKSYLTFAMYYYLVKELNLKVNAVGLDLKKDVIAYCNKVAEELGYDKLKFIHGDIKGFEGFKRVDMIVTLHACDTATDDALVKAINWDARAILSVPCCQHEMYSKIQSDVLNPMLKHGIIKERTAALLTDSLRANVLEILGYSVQMLEFIDMAHTPKNILIRAFKTNKENKQAVEEYKRFKEFFKIDPYIEEAMGDVLKSKLY